MSPSSYLPHFHWGNNFFLFDQVRNNLNIFLGGGRGICPACLAAASVLESIPLSSVFLENTDIEDLVGM